MWPQKKHILRIVQQKVAIRPYGEMATMCSLLCDAWAYEGKVPISDSSFRYNVTIRCYKRQNISYFFLEYRRISNTMYTNEYSEYNANNARCGNIYFIFMIVGSERFIIAPEYQFLSIFCLANRCIILAIIHSRRLRLSH